MNRFLARRVEGVLLRPLWMERLSPWSWKLPRIVIVERPKSVRWRPRKRGIGQIERHGRASLKTGRGSPGEPTSILFWITTNFRVERAKAVQVAMRLQLWGCINGQRESAAIHLLDHQGHQSDQPGTTSHRSTSEKGARRGEERACRGRRRARWLAVVRWACGHGSNRGRPRRDCESVSLLTVVGKRIGYVEVQPIVMEGVWCSCKSRSVSITNPWRIASSMPFRAADLPRPSPPSNWCRWCSRC